MEINREILKLAREARGFSQKELSVILGIEQGTLSKIENEFLSVDESLVDKISDVLKYPKSFFLQRRKVHLLQGHYRKKISSPVKDIRKYLSRMTIVEWHLEKLIEPLESLNINLPNWDCESDGSPETCANYIREFWKIPKGRIDDLSEIIEKNGVIIVPIDLGEIDGFSTFTDSGIPVIFVNKLAPGDRYRHIVAHELGHLIMHFAKKINDIRDTEDEAHTFASELLIPAREITNHLVKLTIEKLTELKAYWKVSMQAILVKAYKHLNAITKNQYHYLYKQIVFLGYKINEPVFIAREEATSIKEIINLHLNGLGYTKSELSTLLHSIEKEFDELYINNGRNLKLVS